jgi:hypothetical protein
VINVWARFCSLLDKHLTCMLMYKTKDKVTRGLYGENDKLLTIAS